jgi:hypothetical protein
MTATHKTDRYAKRGRRRDHPLKDEAIFDTELQRYVMPSERHAAMIKPDKSD